MRSTSVSEPYDWEGEIPARVADHFGVSVSTVYRWLRDAGLHGEHRDGRLVVPFEPNAQFFLAQLNNPRRFRDTAWLPSELSRYGVWHEVLDEFVWLLKVAYTAPQDVKRRRFRLDRLYASYLRRHSVTPDAIRRVLADGRTTPHRLVVDDLKRGWYNELAYSFPLRESLLGLSFADIEANKAISARRFEFPSWRVTCAYYTFYFYARGITLQKQPNIRLHEHSATISAFKHNVLPALRASVWKFPFDLGYVPGRREASRKAVLAAFGSLERAYYRHPRYPNRAPAEIYARLCATFRRRSRRRKRPAPYGLFDFLHDFRVWANYLEIDNLLSLWGPGYRAFLDQNLGAILFFAGGIAELCYLAVFGGDSYVARLQHFYSVLTANGGDLTIQFRKTPPFYRYLIHCELGLAPRALRLKEPEDPNALRLLSSDDA